jgi:hypothetical protein
MGRLDITRQIPVWGWLVLAAAGLVLTGVTFVIDVQIIVTKPNFGDVSGTVSAVGTILTTFATLAAFAIAVYNQVTDGESTESGPESAVTFAGENNDFTVNLQFGPEQTGTQVRDEEQQTPTPSDESDEPTPSEEVLDTGDDTENS